MELTGLPLVVVCWLAAGLVISLGAWVAARGRGPLPGRALVVLAVEVVTCGVVLLAAVVTLNARYQWYSSWGDLAGGVAASPQPTVSPTRSYGRPLDLTAEHAPEGETPLVHEALPTGTYEVYRVVGPRSGYTGQVGVWLPSSYADGRRHPVLQAYPSYPAGLKSLVSGVHLDEMVRDRVAAGDLAAPVVLFPEWAPGNADTECVDAPRGRRMETWSAVDVPAWAKDHLRVASGRDGWATFGYSAGGWCATMASVLHPETYGAGVALGGYTRPIFDQEPAFEPGSPAARRYDLEQLVRTRPPRTSLWMLTSTGDALSWDTTGPFLRAVRAPMHVTAVVDQGVGHRQDSWFTRTPQALAWVGDVLPGFRPRSS